jgi:hypothetical protein
MIFDSKMFSAFPSAHFRQPTKTHMGLFSRIKKDRKLKIESKNKEIKSRKIGNKEQEIKKQRKRTESVKISRRIPPARKTPAWAAP